MHDVLIWTAWGLAGIVLSAVSNLCLPQKVQK